VKTLKVYRSQGAVQNFNLVGSVLKLLGDEAQVVVDGAVIGTWDGTGNDGNLVSNGEYHIKIDSVDTMGTVTTITQPIQVARSLTKTTVLVYNASGEVVKHLFAYLDDPGNGLVNGVQLSSSVLSPTYDPSAGGVPNQILISLGGGATLSWNGQNDQGSFVQGGQYFLEIHSLDGVGGEATITKEVTVRGDLEHSGLGEVTARPNLLDPQSGYLSNLSAALPSTLSVRVYTLAGELVRQFQGGAGTSQATLDASVLASGVYLVVVDVNAPAGGRLQEKTLKVLVLH